MIENLQKTKNVTVFNKNVTHYYINHQKERKGLYKNVLPDESFSYYSHVCFETFIFRVKVVKEVSLSEKISDRSIALTFSI